MNHSECLHEVHYWWERYSGSVCKRHCACAWMCVRCKYESILSSVLFPPKSVHRMALGRAQVRNKSNSPLRLLLPSKQYSEPSAYGKGRASVSVKYWVCFPKWCGLGVGLRSGFKSPLTWPTSQGCCADRRRERILYTTLSLKEGWYNIWKINKYVVCMWKCMALCKKFLSAFIQYCVSKTDECIFARLFLYMWNTAILNSLFLYHIYYNPSLLLRSSGCYPYGPPHFTLTKSQGRWMSGSKPS